MSSEASGGEVDRRGLLYALDRLAIGFESKDPHIRHESKWVAKQNISQIARDCSKYPETDQNIGATDG